MAEQMVTRRNRPNYLILENGIEALSSDSILSGDESQSQVFQPSFTAPQSDIDSFTNVSDNEILPSESASQSPATVSPELVKLYNAPLSQKRKRPAPVTSWVWEFFETTKYASEWTVRKTQKRQTEDQEICCIFIDQKGNRCNWKTTDSARQFSTANMQGHLEKHEIYGPKHEIPTKRKQPSITSLLSGHAGLTRQQILEKNILQWIVKQKQAFTTIESPEFQQIFHDIPGIELPFSSRYMVRQRLMDRFIEQRHKLKCELEITCKTISLSLDVWTSKNHLPILGIIGHWLTEDFKYNKKILDFTELRGIHSGENLAAAVETLLMELRLESKLIAITGDNASNNETMAKELYESLKKRLSFPLLFQGLDSYVRCLAHILNLIVKDILRALRSGSVEDAYAACEGLQTGRPLENQSALAKLRIFALWIHRSPPKQQKWKETCKIESLPDKYVEYDVDTRWNSTYRMLDSGLLARRQIDTFLNFQAEFPLFTTADWLRLSQIRKVLSKFNDFILFVSEKKPQISLAVPIYYALHDLLDNAAERKGDFIDLDHDIAIAVREGIKKYDKYYTFMDASDIYYTALVLDPRIKGEMLIKELQADGDSGRLILHELRRALHQRYPPITYEQAPDIVDSRLLITAMSMRMLFLRCFRS